RPPNSFILYRKEKSQEYRNCTAAKLSRILGARWKKEKPEIKAHFAQRAKDEEEKHAIEHPDYKFQPAK
ncbi:high mobility group box domain-containing protein, partial [Lobosporangium transversale]